MKQSRFYLLSALTIATGLLAGCSSTDDLGTEINPTPVQLKVKGEGMDDITASMSSSVYNILNPSVTRAASKLYPTLESLGIPADMPAEPAIPTDAKELDPSTPYNSHSGNFFVPKGKTITFGANQSFNVEGMNLYVAGNLTISEYWGGNVNIYILKGGKLTIDNNTPELLHNPSTGPATIYNYGTLEKTSNGIYIAKDERLYNAGTLKLGKSDTFKVQGTLYTVNSLKGFENYTFENGCHVNILGDVDMTGKDITISQEGYIHIGGKLKARNLTLSGAGDLLVDCQINIASKFVTNSTNNIYCTYLQSGSMEQEASAKIYLGENGYVQTGDYVNKNNGTYKGDLICGIVYLPTSGHGVISARSISFNGSKGGDTKSSPIYCFQTRGYGRLGVACEDFQYQNNKGGTDKLGTQVTFVNAAVELINDEDKQAQYAIPKDGECNPGFGPEPGPDPDPDKPDIVVVGTQHTHNISATCVNVDGNNVYLSFHKRGNEQSGCLERLAVEGDKVVLKQFVRDHNKSIDFNHLCLDKADKRVYVVGNNKNGGFLGYMRLKDNGDFDCEAKKMGDLDSVSIANKTYQPLQLVKLRQAQDAANEEAKSKKGGDGNAVIVNGDVLQVASTFGFEFFNKKLQGLGTIREPGKGKHIAFCNMGNNKDEFIASYFTKPVTGDEYQAIPLKIERYAGSDKYMENPEVSFDAHDVTPNNGKNTIAEYDGKIYSCQGSRGLYVYNKADGSEVGHYKLDFSKMQDKDKREAAEKTICANGVAVDANYVYVAYGSKGLRVLNRSDLSEVSTFIEGASANYVALANGYIYVAYGLNNIKVFKLDK